MSSRAIRRFRSEHYQAAVDTLLLLHDQLLPEVLPVAPHVEHKLPHYDMEAFLIEAELILDWYLPRLHITITDADRAEFQALWREALAPAIDSAPTWVLRDFHSPNLLWLPKRSELARLGVLDFQDAVMGPAAYDLASLLQDARVDVPEATEVALLGRYVRRRRAAHTDFDGGQFLKIYVTLAAQRASKILGIFARLDMRDGKPQFTSHAANMDLFAAVAGASGAGALNAWYSAHVPALKTI